MQKNDQKASRSRQNFNISNVGYYETCYNNRSTRKLVIGKWQILSNTQKDPYLNQASQTEKYLLKFSYPKKSRNRKFQTPKDPSIIPVTRNPEYPTPLGTESYSCLPVDPLLLECGTKQESGKKIRRMRGLSPPPQPHPLAVFLSAHISFPTKKKLHLFHSLSIPSRCLQKKSTTEQEPIFLRFSRHHCEADLERETRVMHGEQVLQAIKETEISNKASLFLFLFR